MSFAHLALELNDVMYLVNTLKNPSDNVSVFQYVSFCKSSTHSSTQHNLQHNFNRTSKSHHFYFNRIVRIWNKLPFIDLSYSIPHIKQQLLRYLWDHFFSTLIQLTPVLSTFTVLVIHALLHSFFGLSHALEVDPQHSF